MPAIKRAFDVFAAITALIALLPVILIVIVLTAIFLGFPVFFLQKRPGWHGKSFAIIKFRTMIDARNAEGILLPDEARMTPFGRLLRGTSLDELPELFNILKGDMSLVGPRPLLMQYLTRYSAEQARRHEVRPGMTGWAQVHGRNAISWEEKFELDVWYVDNWSFGLDLKIMAMTFLQTLRRKGINQPGQATMEEFKGAMKPL
jgi:sugar transferase EpsL